MSEEQVERRLAAIMAADVVGCSRLMEANEERTLGALRQHRREFFDPTVTKHGGRIFKVMDEGSPKPGRRYRWISGIGCNGRLCREAAVR